MGRSQGIPQYLYLVPTWVSFPDTPLGQPQGKIQGNPRCDSLLGISVTLRSQTFDPVSSRTFTYIGCCTSGIMHWMINATTCWSQPLDTVLWRARGVSSYLGSIPWSYIQKLFFGGEIPPYSNLYVSYRSGLTLWRGYIKIFCCMPCRHIPWYRGWLQGACMLPWPELFPQLRLSSWGGSISSQSSGPQEQFLPIILYGVAPYWLGGWSMFEPISSIQLRSWPRVWFTRDSW